MDMDQAIRDLVRYRAEQEDRAVERACEMAIQTGIFGVSVIHHPDGSVDAKVDPDVPYGRVHHYPVAV